MYFVTSRKIHKYLVGIKRRVYAKLLSTILQVVFSMGKVFCTIFLLNSSKKEIYGPRITYPALKLFEKYKLAQTQFGIK